MNINPGKTAFSDAEHQALRAEVRAVIDGGTSQSQVSKEAQVAASTLSQYLSATYRGDNAAVAADLTRWLKTRAEVQSLRSQIPDEPAYLPLIGSQKVVRTLQYALAAGEIVLIGGAPGTTKTWSLRQFAHDNARVWFTSMDPTTSGVPTMLLEMLAAMGRGEKKGTPQQLLREICQVAGEGKGLIIVDEGQHLSDKALETLRAINDRTRAIGCGVGIAIAGNELAQSRVATTGNKADFAQVSSRIARRVWLDVPNPDDAATLARAWATTNGEEITKVEVAFAKDIAARPGGLRNVEKVMRSALLVARGAGEALTIEHMKGAWSALSSR